MSATRDAFSDSAGSATGTLSWTHTSSSPKGLAVLVSYSDATLVGSVDTVDINGVSLTRVGPVEFSSTGSEVDNTAIELWFRGDSIPSGAQTITVTDNGTAAAKRAVAWSFTATGDTQITNNSGVLSGTAANPSSTLTLGGVESSIYIYFRSGQNDVTGIAPSTGWTSDFEEDIGSVTAGAYYRDALSTADVTVGFDHANEQYAYHAFAVSEAAGGAVDFSAYHTPTFLAYSRQ